MSRFYKAVEGTDAYERFGEELISSEAVARYEFRDMRKNVVSADQEDIARELRKPENCDDMDLIKELCDMAGMLDEWEAEEDDPWGLAYDAAEKLGVEI